MVKSIVENSPNASMVVARARRVLDFRDRKRRVHRAEARRALTDVEQAIFAAVDERTHQHGADDAEDRGVGADAERQRDDDGGGQALGAPQRAHADAHFAAERGEGVEPAGVPDAPHRFAHVRDVAELAQRGEARRLGIFAAIDPLLHAEREMAADFVVEIAIVGSHDATPCSPPDS